MLQKIQVSSDTLYQFLLEHGVKSSRLSEFMGLSNGSLISCFTHQMLQTGKQRKFTRKTVKRLNDALEQMADTLRSSVFTFGSEQTYTNQWGNTYDPALLEPMKELGKLVNLTALVERVLGWNKFKKQAVFVSKNSNSYGCISQDDVNRVNAELLAIAGVLSSYEVVPDADSCSGIHTDEANKKAQAYGKRPACGKDADVEQVQLWDDTSQPLLERYHIFHEQRPEDILLFRVNAGYTAAQDDSRHLCELCESLYTYTDLTTGLTTSYIDAEQFAGIAEICIEKGWRISVTEMYGKE